MQYILTIKQLANQDEKPAESNPPGSPEQLPLCNLCHWLYLHLVVQPSELI